jgi:hypothetical protein
MAVKNCTHGIVALASSSCGHTSPLIKYYFMHLLSKPSSFFLLHPSNARLDSYQDLPEAMVRYDELL